MATLTVTPTQTFISGDTVLPATLNQLAQSTVALTAGSIVAADIADAAVTTAKLAAVTAQSLLPAGAVMPFARATAPAGWLIANGDAVPNGSGTVQGVTADFSALYAAVSTSFGTVGTLPDLRGIFVRGSDSQTISGTTYSGTFAAKQQDEFKAHTHTVSGGGSTGLVGGGGSAGLTTTQTTSSAGGDETRPANIALLYCIKF
jgi:hypothetical protein